MARLVGKLKRKGRFNVLFCSFSSWFVRRLKPEKRTLKRPLKNRRPFDRAINGRGYVPPTAESLVNEAESA